MLNQQKNRRRRKKQRQVERMKEKRKQKTFDLENQIQKWKIAIMNPIMGIKLRSSHFDL